MSNICGLIAINGTGQHKCTFDLEYLNEGAANIVFRITNLQPLGSTTTSCFDLDTLDHQPSIQYLQNKVIRFRKADVEAEQVEENVKDWQTVVKSLDLPPDSHCFPVPRLCRVHDVLRQRCNTALSSRQVRGDRSSVVSMLEPFAAIMDDVSTAAEDYVQMEFKPKWLAPSPSAPDDATCCRTCALNNMRFEAGVDHQRLRSKLCPLGHLVGTHEFRRNLIDSYQLSDIKDKQLETWLEELRTQIWFQSLRKAQITHDALGPSSDDAHLTSLDFRIAMTLRDCSLILKIPKHTSSDMLVRSAMIDLDLKPASAKKRAQWRETERKLVDEGWYRSSGVELAKRGIRCYLGEYKMAVAHGEIG